MYRTLLVRTILRSQRAQRSVHILGIETSCDDTAVAIVRDDHQVLSSIRYTDRVDQQKRGGICPAAVAQQHRHHLPRIISECMKNANLNMRDIDAVAVTRTPGLVIALKEGVQMAVNICRKNKKPLIPVHHMRAHALVAGLVHNDLKFPFLAILISGGHSMFVVFRSPEQCFIYGKSLSGSAGECIDKVGREIGVLSLDSTSVMHVGAVVEQLASRASEHGHLRYTVLGPQVHRADMNFSQLKSSFLTLARKEGTKEGFRFEDFCASLQFHVTRHICIRLHYVMDYLNRTSTGEIKHVVVSGGVGANQYIMNAVKKLSAYHGMEVLAVPAELCTDNAEMIAWTGCLKYQSRSPDIIPPSEIPETIYVDARSPIGVDMRHMIAHKPDSKLSGVSVHGDLPIKTSSRESYRRAVKE